jgi:ribosomal protein L12E/L44/L45/RPP1/RPP2
MVANAQSALVYAAFVCDGNADAAKLQAVCKAAGVDVAPGMAKNFAAILAKKSLADVLKNVQLGGGGGAGAAPSASAAAPAPPRRRRRRRRSRRATTRWASVSSTKMAYAETCRNASRTAPPNSA